MAKPPAASAQRLDGLDHEIAAIQERSRLLQDEIGAKLAAETNRHLFALSMVTVFLLPPTLVAGVFGMNVSELPFTKDAGGFPWAIGLTAASSAVVFAVMRWLRIIRWPRLPGRTGRIGLVDDLWPKFRARSSYCRHEGPLSAAPIQSMGPGGRTA